MPITWCLHSGNKARKVLVKILLPSDDCLGMSYILRALVFLRPVAYLLLLCSAGVGCCKEAEVPYAMRGLYSSEPRERNRALHVLAQCPDRAQAAIQRIAALMYDSNVGVASSAAYALRKIDSPEAKEALKVAEEARSRRRIKR